MDTTSDCKDTVSLPLEWPSTVRNFDSFCIRSTTLRRGFAFSTYKDTWVENQNHTCAAAGQSTDTHMHNPRDND